MSDTPRTDIMASGNSNPSQDEYEEMCQFARQLERELTAANKEKFNAYKAGMRIAAEEAKTSLGYPTEASEAILSLAETVKESEMV